MSLALTGCGDLAGRGTSASGARSISGRVTAGPIKGATVQVYKLVRNSVGKLVQGDAVGPAGTTNADGSYTIGNLPDNIGPVVVVVSGRPGASYLDETGVTVPFGANDRLTAAVSQVQNGQTVQITPVTDYAVKFIQDNATQLGGDPAQAVQLGNLKVGEKFGLSNIVGLAPAIVKGEYNNVAQSTTEQLNYGLVLAGLAKLTQEVRSENPTTSISQVVQQVMGAKNDAGGYVAGDTAQLSAAIASYTKSSANETGVVAIPPLLANAIANADAVALPTPAQLADLTAPTAPAGLSAAVGSGRVELTWQAASDDVGVAGYYVYRNGTSLGRTLGTGFADPLVSAGASYTYRVEAFDAAGNVSPRGEIVSVSVPAPQVADTQPPSIPAALTVFGLSYNKLSLAWDAASDNRAVAGYDIYRDDIYQGTVGADQTVYPDTTVVSATPYRYRVEAFDAAGNRSRSVELPLVTAKDPALPSAPPAIPAGLAVTGSSYASVRLSWSAVTGAAGYKVYRDGGLEIATLGAAVGVTPAYTDVTVLPKSSYSYFVKAVDAVGNLSAASAPVTVTTPADPANASAVKPAAPANLSVAAITSDSVALIWSPVQGATGYNVYRGGVRVGSSYVTGFSDASIAPNQNYSYTVTAFDRAGNESVVSTPLALITPTPPPAGDTSAPSAPVNLAAPASGVGSTLISFNWSPSSDDVAVAGYEIIKNGQVFASGLTQTSFSDSEVNPNTTYVYRVRAYDAAGNRSALSTALSVTTLAPPVTGDSTAPSAPGNLAYAATPTSVVLTWSAATDNVGVTGYEVYRSGSYLGSVSQPGYLDVTVLPGNSYSYYVVALDGTGNRSAASALLPATTPPVPASGDLTAPSVPAAFTAQANASQVVLSWSASSDNLAVTGYEVYRNGVRLTTVTSPAYTDLGIVSSTTYNYFVVAFDAAGNRSAASNTLTVTTQVIPPDTAAPSAPANLHTTAVAGNSVTLAWSASTDNVAVAGYRIYRNGSLIATSTQPAYTDAMTVQPTTSYSYTVSAFDAAGNESAQSSAASATTTTLTVTVTGQLDPSIGQLPSRDIAAPSTPAGLSALTYAVSSTTSSVVLSWTPAGDNVAVTGYDVYRNGSKIATVTVAGYTDPSVSSGAGYSYSVIAFDAAGNRSAASAALAVTPGTPSLGVTVSGALDPSITGLPQGVDLFNPSAPTNLVAVAFANSATTSSVALSWNPATDNVRVAGYEVYRNGTRIAVVTTPGYTDTTALSGTGYTYLVIAFDPSANRSSATQLSVTPNRPSLGVTVSGSLSGGILGLPGHDITAPAAPSGLAATTYANNATTSAVLLSWGAASDNVAVTGYEVYRSGVKVATVAGTSYIDPSVNSGALYNYQVVAFDAEGNRSAASNQLSVTPRVASLGVTVSGQLSSAILALPGMDIVAPTVPAGLALSSAALTATTSQVLLTWSGSADNLAVTGYAIYRNGVQVATSSQNRYTDGPVASGASYSYAVLAYDAAGNRSALGAPVSINPNLVNLGVTVGGGLASALLGP